MPYLYTHPFHLASPCHCCPVFQEAFNMLTIEDPSPEVLKQRRCMEYILRSVLEGAKPMDKGNLQRLRLLVHGPGGCGKSVVTRAAAHMLRQSGQGVVLAALQHQWDHLAFQFAAAGPEPKLWQSVRRAAAPG